MIDQKASQCGLWFYCLLQSVTTSEPYHSGKSIKFQLTIDWFPAKLNFAESLSFFFLIVLGFCQWSWLCQEMYRYIWHWIWNIVNAKYDEKKLPHNTCIYFISKILLIKPLIVCSWCWMNCCQFWCKWEMVHFDTFKNTGTCIIKRVILTYVC